MSKKRVITDNSLVDSVRQLNNLSNQYVTPRFDPRAYSETMQSLDGVYSGPDEDRASFVDAFSSFMADRASTNVLNSSYNAIDDLSSYNTLVNARQYLEDKDKFYNLIDEVKLDPTKYKSLEEQINFYKDRVNKNTGDYIKSFSEVVKAPEAYTPSAAATGYVNLPTNRIDYFSMNNNDLKNILDKLINTYEQRNELNLQEVLSYLDDYNKWNNKISGYYKYRKTLPGMDLTDLDTYVYKLPGLMGSSAATLGANVLGLAGAALMMVPDPTGITKVAGAAITTGANLYSRSNESGAEAYGAYKDTVKNNAESANISKTVLSDAKKEMLNSGKYTEVQLNDDDFVYDQILSGQIPTNNEKFKNILKDALKKLSSVYKDNMTLSTLGVAEDILAVMPLGKIVNGAKKILPGSVIKGVEKAVTLGTGLKSLAALRIVDVAEFGMEGINKLPLKSARKKLLDLGGRVVLTSAMEGAEEGTLYMISKDFLKGDADPDRNVVSRYIDNVGKGIRSLYAALTPFDPVYSDDKEFMENFKGGALLGGLMTGAIGGVTTASSIYDYTKNLFPTTLLLSQVYADKVAKEDAIKKSLIYADYYRSGKWNRIENAFDELENMNIEGLDKEDIRQLRILANKFLNYYTSPLNLLQAKALGIDPKSDDYSLLTALKQHHYEELQNANVLTSSRLGQLELSLNSKDADDYINNLLPVKDGKINISQVKLAIFNKTALDKTNELLGDLETNKDAVTEILNKLGLKVNKSDLISITNILKKFKKDTEKSINSNKELLESIDKAGITPELLSIPTIHKDFSQLMEDYIGSELDARKARSEFDIIGSFKKDEVQAKLDKYKQKEERNIDFIQLINDSYSGKTIANNIDKEEEVTVDPIDQSVPTIELPVNVPIQSTETIEPQIPVLLTNTTGQLVKSSTEPLNASNKQLLDKEQKLKLIAKESGNEEWILGTLDGTFAGLGKLNIDDLENVILTRFTNDMDALTKNGEMTPEEMQEVGYGKFGGNLVPTSGLDNWNETGTTYGKFKGTYKIPYNEFIKLVKLGYIWLANISNGEFSLAPQIAKKYLSEINGKNAIDKVVWSVKELKYIPVTQLSEKDLAELDKTRSDILDYRSNIVTKLNNISDNSDEGKLSRQIGTKLESYTRMVSPEGKTEFFKEAYLDMMKKGYTEFKAHGIMQDDPRWLDLYEAKLKLDEALLNNDNVKLAYDNALLAIYNFDNYNRLEETESELSRLEIKDNNQKQDINIAILLNPSNIQLEDRSTEDVLDEPADEMYREPNEPIMTLNDVMAAQFGSSYTDAVTLLLEQLVLTPTELTKTQDDEGKITPLTYDLNIDNMSHQLSYRLTDSTRDPKTGAYSRVAKRHLGMEEYANNDEFAKVTANDDFIPEVTKNGVEIVVKPYTDNKGNTTDAIYTLFNYKGKKYIAYVSTVAGILSRSNRAFLAKPFAEQLTIVNNLTELRNKIINLNKQIANKPGFRIEPTNLHVTNGTYVNEKNADGSPKNRPLTLSSWLKEKDPYKITPLNTTIAITTGPTGGNQMRLADKIISLEGTSMGAALLITTKLRSDGTTGEVKIKLNPLKFKDSPWIADTILDLVSNPNDTFVDKNGVRTPIRNIDLLNLIVNFGELTYADKSKDMLDDALLARKSEKLFYIADNNTIVLGNSTYSYSDLQLGNPLREKAKQYIIDNLHWNLDLKGLSRNYFGGDLQSKVKQPGFDSMPAFFKNGTIDKIVVVPNQLEFTLKDFGIEGESNNKTISKSNPQGISTLGWYIKQGILQTDVADQMQDANIYMDDVRIVDTAIENTMKETADVVANAEIKEVSDDLRNRVYDMPGENGGRNIINMADIWDIIDGKDRKKNPDNTGANMQVLLDRYDTYTLNPTEASTWLENKLGISPEIIPSVIDITEAGAAVVGRATKDSIILSKVAPIGTLYHEAWHRVSQLLISEKTRRKIYDRYNRVNKTNLSDPLIDEILAEDYREFALYADSKKDSLLKYDFETKNWFRKIFDFARLWARTGSFGLAKLQYYISAGKYRGIQPNEANIARFKNIYSNTGVDLLISGHNFENITNWKQVDDISKSLMYAFFLTNFATNNINYSELSKMDINFDKLYTLVKNTAELYPNPVMDEVVEKFNSVFAPLISLKLKSLGIRTFDKHEIENLNDIEEGVEGVNIGEHIIEGLNISIKDNAPAEIKFFMLTIPEFVYDKEGRAVVRLHPNTTFANFVDDKVAWTKVLKDLAGCRTIGNILAKVLNLADNDIFYKSVLNRLMTLVKQSKDVDSNIAVNAEAMLSKLETVITSDINNFVTVKVESQPDSGFTTMRLIDNSVDYKAAKYPRIWSSSLFNQGGIFKYEGDKIVATKNAKQLLSSLSTAMNNLISAFTKNKGILKIDDKSLDLHQTNVLDGAKLYLVNIFANLGINIDKDTINEMFKSGKYGNPNADAYTLLDNFITSRVNFGGFSKLISVVNTINKAIKDNGEVKDIDFGDGVVSPTDLLNNLGFVKTLANTYAYVHSSDNGLSSMGPDGNNYYKVSLNNFTKDRVNELMTDVNIKLLLSSVVYNLNSVILKALLSPDTLLQVESFINFKDSTSYDTGRDYFNITDREDYLAKMAAIFSNRLIFPTVADKKTYHFLSGIKLPHERVNFTKDELGLLHTMYGDQSLDTMLGYINDERARVELTLRQIDDDPSHFIDGIHYNQDGTINNDWLEPDKRIKNYHTSNKYKDAEGKSRSIEGNGTRFISFNGIYTNKGFINFNDPKKTSRENLLTAYDYFFNLPVTTLKMFLSGIINKRVKEAVEYTKSLGIIDGNDNNNIWSLRNILLDDQELLNRIEHYRTLDPTNAEGYAIWDMLSDYTINSIISINEIEKVFSGDPAYYKISYNENGMVDSSVDKIKRLGSLTSTGTNNRLDFFDDIINDNYKVAELNDHEVVDKQYDTYLDLFTKGNLKETIIELEGLDKWNEVKDKSFDELKELYPNAYKIALLASIREVSGYKSVNVADAAVYISPNMFRNLMRMQGKWSPEIKNAFKLLTDPETADKWESDPKLYSKANKTILNALKYMAFGTRFRNGLAIPYFNKMALFPLFKSIATGDIKPLYDRMTLEGNELDMVMFNSAVKAGSEAPMDYYKDGLISDLNQLHTYDQRYKYLRQQLVTDPHTHEELMAGTLFMKVNLSNLRMEDMYGKEGELISGLLIKLNIMWALNELSDIGKAKLQLLLFNDSGEVDIDKLSKMLLDDARLSDADDNIITGLLTKLGAFNMPLSALSDNKWLESRFISMINKNVIDVNLPGGAFILRSVFGQEATQLSVITPSMIGDGRALKMINEEGSMDAVVSINMFKHIIPNYNKMTFTQARLWLIDNNIIGDKATANSIGYRIPTLSIASISALRFVDVFPSIMGDTVMLPEGFTKLTGSDFDIDKLYISRLLYKDGKVIEDINGEEGIKNHLLLNYLKVLLTKDNTNALKLSIDVSTDNVKAILSDIESNRQQSNVEPFAVYTPGFLEDKKAEYTGGKAGIGPFSLNNAHHILTLLTNFEMVKNPLTLELGIYDISRIYDLPTLLNPKGGRILDWLSAMINAFVDIAKDPYIVRLNVNAWTYNMVSFLLRAGKGKLTFYFMSQPILKDMANAVLKTKGKYGIDRTKSPSQLEREAINDVLSKYDPTGSLLKKYSLLTSTPELAAQTLKGLFLETKDSSFLRDVLLSDEYKTNENLIKIYYAFKAIKPYADSLANLVKYSKIDTKRTGKNFTELMSYLNGMEAMKKDPNFAPGEVEKFYNDTFIQHKTDNSIPFGISIFKNLLLRNSDKFISKKDEVLSLLGRKDNAGSKLLNPLVSSMETSIKSNFFKSYAKLNNIDLNTMFKGNYSMAKRLNNFKLRIQKGEFPDLLIDGKMLNDFLDFLLPNINGDYNLDFIDTSELLDQDQSNTNNLINYWRELINHPNEQVSKLFLDLAVYAFYTSGDNSTMNSFFKYLPNDHRINIGYSDYILEQLNNLNDPNINWDTDSEDIFLNNWNNDALVRPVNLFNSKGFELKNIRLNESSIMPNVIVGEYANDITAAIRPIAWILTEEGKRPLFQPYIKIKDNNGYKAANWHVYKLIGYKERPVEGLSNYTPVYGLIEKKGYKAGGHTILEYGKPTSLDFNKELVWDYYQAIENPIALADMASEYQSDLWLELIDNNGIKHINQLESYRDYLNNDNVDSPYEEDVDDSNDTMDGYTSPLAEIDEPNTKSNNIELNSSTDLSSSVKTYSGMITSLKPNQVFVFGSNTQGRHGKGAALIARNKFGAVYGLAEGIQGLSYGIITKDLTKSTHPSRTVTEIQLQVHNLYEYAKLNPDKEFMVAYSGTGTNLNAYSNQEMADMFSSESIPNNMVFEENFAKLLSSNNLNTKSNVIELSTTDKYIIYTNHSGGARGSDSIWGEIGAEYGVKSNHYYAQGEKTPKGNVELTKQLLAEADMHLTEANKTLKRRFPTSNEYVNNLLRRNWYLVKNSDAIFAIGKIINNIVDGGTGWAVLMAKDNGKSVYAFDINSNQWKSWNYNTNTWDNIDTPILTQNFAGIGTREIPESGIQAIKDVYKKTFGTNNKIESVDEMINKPISTTNNEGLRIMDLYETGKNKIRTELADLNLTDEQSLEYENKFAEQLRNNNVTTNDQLEEQLRQFICNL